MSTAVLRSFAPTERFVTEVRDNKLRSAYVFLGDEAFFRDRCRAALLAHLIPPDMRDFSLHDIDLSDVSITEVLDRARTPSLMAPFQVFTVRGVKALYTRGAHKEEFAAIAEYTKDPNPSAVVIFIADHVHIPSDVRKMEMQDRDRAERIRETLGEQCGCVVLELARVEENDAVRWVTDHAQQQGTVIEQDAARELVDSLGADMLMVQNELEKLVLYTGEKKRITLGDVESLVLAAKQRSLYQLTDALSQRDRTRALETLEALLNTTSGEDAAIGLLFMLAKTYRQMLVILERNVRDSRAIWQALWQGFRIPPFAAEDIIKQARRFKTRRELTRALRLIARADLALRSSPPSKRLILENLMLDLTAEPKTSASLWEQMEFAN